jgi:hypothetical protein
MRSLGVITSDSALVMNVYSIAHRAHASVAGDNTMQRRDCPETPATAKFAGHK